MNFVRQLTIWSAWFLTLLNNATYLMKQKPSSNGKIPTALVQVILNNG
jgi:hypothetical protein